MADAPASSPLIDYDDFAKLDLRVARVTEAVEHPNADRLFLLKVDLGHEQRQLCAGLRGHYTADELVGQSVIVVANLAPRKMRGEVSQGMLLAASDNDKNAVIVLTTAAPIAPGSKVS